MSERSDTATYGTLAMALEPERWPGYRLPMMRLEGGQIVEHGRIGRTVRADLIVVRSYDGERVLGEFGSGDELAAAGWRVD